MSVNWKRFFELSLVGVLLSLTILIVSVWKAVQIKVWAESEENLLGTKSGEVVLVSDYQLVYPGILPGHPLYFIKMVRDRVKLWLVSNGEKKLDLMLLYADKRMAAVESLLKKKQIDLALSTATKSVTYLEMAIEGKRDRVWWEKIRRVTVYYEGVLNNLMINSSDEAKAIVGSLKERVLRIKAKAIDETGFSMVEESSKSAVPIDTEPSL